MTDRDKAREQEALGNPATPSALPGNGKNLGKPVIQLENVGLQAGRSSMLLLQDVSFAVMPGERLALFGPGGSGKTLLFRLLNNLVSATQGKIFWQGQPLEQVPAPELRRQVVWVSRTPNLLGLPVADAIAYPLRLQNLSNAAIQQRIQHWLEILQWPTPWLEQAAPPTSDPGLDPLFNPWQVALLRALVLEPRLLLLELPRWNQPPDTTLLDQFDQTLHFALTRLQAQGSAVILASRGPGGFLQGKTLQGIGRLLALQQSRLQIWSDLEAWQLSQATIQERAIATTATNAEEEDWGDEEEELF